MSADGPPQGTGPLGGAAPGAVRGQHPSAVRASFERMLAAGKDNALLRFSLGQECLRAGEAGLAADHFAHALVFDPDYTAAWKLKGQALFDSGQIAKAITAYQEGIAVAQRKGDKQALREMQVFLKRAEKRLAEGDA